MCGLQVSVSVEDELKFKVFFNHDNLDIVWSDVSSFNHSSHGILGKCLLVHQTSTSVTSCDTMECIDFQVSSSTRELR